MSNVDEWNEDSILSRNGYSADGSLSVWGRKNVLNKIIINNDTASQLEAIRHFRMLIDCRGDNKPKAKRIWEEDLIYFINTINEINTNNLLSSSRQKS